MIYILGNTQKLILKQKDKTLTYSISTALKGFGEIANSFQTPRGLHRIHQKIGDNLPENAVFIARRFTEEIYTPTLAAANPSRDWILTRILWLEGLEPSNENTLSRFIYIHGTPDSEPIGIPGSQGCIRMRNKDIIELFELVNVEDEVRISSS
jgi:L,D-transpeptidase YbiS